MNDRKNVYHIAEIKRFERFREAREPYTPPSLELEGFIHCSYEHQVEAVANRLYHGTSGLVILEIAQALVPSPIVDEDCYQSGEKFPHIYGPVPIHAVHRVFHFAPDPEGRFSFPCASDV